MSSIPPHFNFAKATGIQSLAGAIVFTVLYAPLLAFFIRKCFTHPTYVHYVLTFFCAIRVAAFAIRTALAASSSAGESLGLVIAESTLFGVGYFSLLYSAYTLVLDRMLISDVPPSNHPLLRLTQNRRIFRLAVLLALVLGIVASSTTNSNGTSTTTTKSLHIASTAIFLVLTVLQVIQTVILAKSGMSGRSQYYIRDKDSIGVRYGNYILLVISLLMLIRETFAMATVTNSAKQDNEHFWYPLLALPEILVVILYTTPGLVPRAAELPTYSPAVAS
ncbi:hypothetical protein BYT27DRAFT_7136418 [Phlegmacium glaucopus]|nr:hypothetical protein BYT27DRAFT_7136418 [Phlegmacium glaucopus]